MKKQLINTNAPLFIELHPTNACNSNCFFCNQKVFRNKRDQLEFRDIKNILNDLGKKGLAQIRLSGGGEPLVHPDFRSIYKFIQESNLMIVGLNTNGLLLEKYMDLFCSKPYLETMNVSLQAPTATIWSKITKQRPEKFEEIVNSINIFSLKKNEKQDLILSFVLSEETIEHLSQIEKIIEKNDAKCVVHDLNTHNYSQSFLDQLKSKTHFLMELKKKLNLVYHFYNIPFLKHLSDYHPIQLQRKKMVSLSNSAICTAPWISLLLRPDGSCSTCCALGGGKQKFGNILNQSIEEIWNSQIRQEIQKEACELFFTNCDYETRTKINTQYLNKMCVTYCPVQYRYFSKLKIAKAIRSKSDIISPTY